MLRPVHVDPHATGFFAAGQFATGVIAFGQFATGVIAIGQFARGVFALGQFSIGLFSAGMFTAGVFSGAGAGVAGRGVGLVLSCVPTVGPPRVAPPTSTIDALDRSQTPGWVRVMLRRDDLAFSIVEADSPRPTPVKITPLHSASIRGAVRKGESDALAWIERAVDGTHVCTRLMRVPRPAWERTGFMKEALARTAGLVVLALAFWLVVGLPLVHDLR